MRTCIPYAVMWALSCAAVPAAAQDPGRDRPPPPAVPIHAAALQGDGEAIRAHAAAGSDLDAYDAFGSTPLLVATTFGHAAAASALLGAGADPTLANPQGHPPLHVAAFLGRAGIVETLLAHGADPATLDPDGGLGYDLAAVPAIDDRTVLDELRTGLAPLGLQLDEADVDAGRRVAAALLRTDPSTVDPSVYRPYEGGRWPTSSPEAEGLDAAAVARLYAEAADLEAIRAVLIVRHGRLVAEEYFNGWARDRPSLLQSVTKSVTSALTGIALERGCLESLDQPMIEFFPDQAARIRDPRKREITVRQMLQMRAGYGWEGADSLRWEGLIGGDYPPLLVDFALDRDPGSGFDYSNVTSHLLGVVVARACDTDLMTLARESLFGPLGITPGPWRTDPHGDRYGHAELELTARDLARFGLLYLDAGRHDGRPLIPEDWVAASLTGYSSDIDTAGIRAGRVGRWFRDIEYGYQWWSAEVAGRRFSFAWGHGGQMAVLLDDADTVVVVLSDPFYRPVREDHEAWTQEQANFNLVGRFLASLTPG